MRLTKQLFFLNHRRIRSVMDYLGQHLDDETITLDTLAEIACLSRYHFVRLYMAKVLETPMSTVCRLRLIRARELLQTGRCDSVTDLAVQSGYGSVAAFSRAYSRAYGVAPSREKLAALPSSLPELQIVDLLPRRVVCLPFFGRARDMFDAGNDLSWMVAASGAQRWRHWLMLQGSVTDIECQPDAWVRVLHCVPADTLPPHVPGVDWGWLPGGKYARFAFVGQEPFGLDQLAARIAAETTWGLGDAPVLSNMPKVPNYTPPSERIVHLYLPIVPQ